MAVSDDLFSAEVSNQIALTRLSAGEARTVLPFLREIVKYLEERLAKEGDSIANKKRLDILLSDVKSKLDEIYTEWELSFFDDVLPEIAVEQALFQSKAINTTVPDYQSVIPTAEQLLTAAKVNPLVINKNLGSVNFDKYIKAWKPQEIERINNAIKGGFYSGQTPQQITRNLVGNKSQGYKNGLVNISKNTIYTVVKTSINHMSVTAKDEFNKQNKDLIIGYEIVATLDSKTSDTCKHYDGRKFYYKNGRNQPKPPFHPNCRSTTSPLLDSKYDFLDEGGTRPSIGEKDGEKVAKKVPSDMTYYEWLKTQPSSLQNEALGKTKAMIFRNAGITEEEFNKASRDRLNQPLTIKEMAASNKKIHDYLESLSKRDSRVKQYID